VFFEVNSNDFGAPMFMSLYPVEVLTRVRVLQVRGERRGLCVVPKPPPPDSEVVHVQSMVVITPEHRTGFVIEWTGTTISSHRVDL
jgi:hypothetical protein